MWTLLLRFNAVQPDTHKILKVGSVGYQNQLKKKTIHEKKGSAQNPAFCAGLYIDTGYMLAVIYEYFTCTALQPNLDDACNHIKSAFLNCNIPIRKELH